MAMLRDLAETRRWYEGYIAANANKLTPSAPLILAVQGDELDLSLLDVRIEDLRSRSPGTERFCQDCRDLFYNWPDLSDTTATRPDGTSCFPGIGANWKHAVARSCHTVQLEAAARNGCHFCALLFQVLRDTQLLPIFRRIEARIESLGHSAEAYLSLQNWGRNSDQLIWLNWPGKVSTSCNAGIGAMQRIVSATLKSDALSNYENCNVVNITRRWLQDCDEHHTDCNNAQVGTLPGRLLYVGENQVRLASTAGWASGCRYTTLSHRWNTDDFAMLLRENVDALSIAVPEQALPRTFSDAIEITRRLGIDYIWIDSLCIIQDDEDDWRRETAIMEHIYGGSYVNVAASSATSVHGGCWVSNNETHNAFRTKVKVGDDELVREIRDDAFYDRAVWDSHLATRAWALQEKLLSPRNLHLGDRGAIWECRSTIANEDLPDGFTQNLGSGLLRRTRSLQYLQQWWADVVRLFTKADLTYARDKLPALSGIARHVHSQKGGQYLAGLWRDERIEAQLCWRVDEPRLRPTMWRAPSWSWASVDGPVSYAPTQSGICEDEYAHVVDARVTPLAGDVFSELTGGVLHISCAGFLRGHVVDCDNVIVSGDDETFHCPVFLDTLDESYLSPDITVYLLPLIGGKQGSIVRRDGGQFEPKLILGMVLRATRDNPREFRRIGAFRCEQAQVPETSVENDLYHGFTQRLERYGKEVGRLLCASPVQETEHCSETFGITIV